MNKDQFVGFEIGLFAGVLIGGALALFFAPQSGKEARDLVKQKALDIREQAAEVAEDVKDLAQGTMEKVRTTAAGIKRGEDTSAGESTG